MKLTKAQQKVTEDAQDAMTNADKFEIISEERAEQAAAFLRGIKGLIKQATDLFSEPKRKAKEAHQAVIDAERSVVDPLKRAEVIIKNKIADWIRVQERAAREQQLRLEAEARKVAVEQAEAEAEAVESVDPATARAIRSTLPALQTSAVSSVRVAPPAVPKGVSSRLLHRAKVYDMVALILWVAEDPLARALYVQPNDSHLSSVASTSKGAAVVPGVEFYTETSVAVR